MLIAIVKKDYVCGITKALLNYARAFLLQYKVSFVDNGIKDIVEDAMSSRFLQTRCRDIHSLCVVRQLFLKIEQLLPLSQKLKKET